MATWPRPWPSLVLRVIHTWGKKSNSNSSGVGRIGGARVLTDREIVTFRYHPTTHLLITVPQISSSRCATDMSSCAQAGPDRWPPGTDHWLGQAVDQCRQIAGAAEPRGAAHVVGQVRTGVRLNRCAPVAPIDRWRVDVCGRGGTGCLPWVRWGTADHTGPGPVRPDRHYVVRGGNVRRTEHAERVHLDRTLRAVD